ncbi:predicted protein [Plenodomus lingam JN3]|uniref:Predicted protein n=1 Tax=Leptosphaeria maculans (strain JN3 / isolate v23.1.3 / race Av1-4-5-6-7-8) TaxID=985895 RepID=E5A192_LEPMJ|nr:predicted protein [Plenodomus lingam JN3]CBX97356.1 predicted protein [Plenodomus lingam JN3]
MQGRAAGFRSKEHLLICKLLQAASLQKSSPPLAAPVRIQSFFFSFSLFLPSFLPSFLPVHVPCPSTCTTHMADHVPVLATEEDKQVSRISCPRYMSHTYKQPWRGGMAGAGGRYGWRESANAMLSRTAGVGNHVGRWEVGRKEQAEPPGFVIAEAAHAGSPKKTWLDPSVPFGPGNRHQC